MPVRVLLEMIRILVIILFFGAIMGGLLNFIYDAIGINVKNTSGGWLVGISIYIVLFVLYQTDSSFQVL